MKHKYIFKKDTIQEQMDKLYSSLTDEEKDLVKAIEIGVGEYIDNEITNLELEFQDLRKRIAAKRDKRKTK